MGDAHALRRLRETCVRVSLYRTSYYASIILSKKRHDLLAYVTVYLPIALVMYNYIRAHLLLLDTKRSIEHLFLICVSYYNFSHSACHQNHSRYVHQNRLHKNMNICI
jgi:hypothetical protein